MWSIPRGLTWVALYSLPRVEGHFVVGAGTLGVGTQAVDTEGGGSGQF